MLKSAESIFKPVDMSGCPVMLLLVSARRSLLPFWRFLFWQIPGPSGFWVYVYKKYIRHNPSTGNPFVPVLSAGSSLLCRDSRFSFWQILPWIFFQVKFIAKLFLRLTSYIGTAFRTVHCSNPLIFDRKCRIRRKNVNQKRTIMKTESNIPFW